MDGSWLKILLNKLMISGYPYFRCSFIINGKSYKNEWFRYFRKPPCIPHKANQTSLARPALGGAGRLFSLLLHRPEAQGIWAITSRATRLPRLKTGSHGGSPCLDWWTLHVWWRNLNFLLVKSQKSKPNFCMSAPYLWIENRIHGHG